MRLLLFLFVAVSAFSGCDVFCDDCEQTYASLFEDDVTARATPDRAVYDQPITIRATITPRFTGTGAFALSHNSGGRTVEVVAPTAEIIEAGDVHVYPVKFEAGVPEVVEWTIRLGPRNGYVDGHGFPITVSADSVEVRGTLLHAESEEVREAFRDGRGNLVTSAMHWPRLVLQ